MDTRIWTKTSIVGAIITVVLGLVGAPAASASLDDTTLYLLGANSGPQGIVTGPDGNLWFTERYANKIGRITPDGAITEYPVPTAYSDPLGITAGPDGNLWFTAPGVGPPGCSGSRIGRITLDGVITEYPLPWASDPHSTTQGSCPRGITAGPDGNLWFAEYTGNAIGRITVDGVITEYPLPKFGGPEGIATGPDGNIWFTESDANKIGRITPYGAITEYPLLYGDRPHGIAAGPDGNMWFTEGGDPNYRWSGNRIGRITPGGEITEYQLPTKASFPDAITAGPDGNMWFTRRGGVGRITLDGRITEYFVDTAFTRSGITTGPDGNLWFTATDAIGRISPSATPTMVKRGCPIRVTLHKPTPNAVGSRILTDRIATNSSCVLRTPIVLCRPLSSTGAGEKAFCDTKVTRRGRIRVDTQSYEGVRVTVIVRAAPKAGQGDVWKADAWRKRWFLR